MNPRGFSNLPSGFIFKWLWTLPSLFAAYFNISTSVNSTRSSVRCKTGGERLYLTMCFDSGHADGTSETRHFRQDARLIVHHHLSLQIWSPFFGLPPETVGSSDPIINSNQQLRSKIRLPIKLHSYLWNVLPALGEKHCKLLLGWCILCERRRHVDSWSVKSGSWVLLYSYTGNI